MITAGNKAPDFTGTDQHGNTVRLGDFSGKKLVLYFYPKDDTPGCTAQACNLRDNLDLLADKGIAVVGVSIDNQKKHLKFADKYGLNFPLIADDSQTIVNAYGVFGEKKFMGRTYMGTQRITFLINESSIIDKVIEKPDTKGQAAQVLEAWSLH